MSLKDEKVDNNDLAQPDDDDPASGDSATENSDLEDMGSDIEDPEQDLDDSIMSNEEEVDKIQSHESDTDTDTDDEYETDDEYLQKLDNNLRQDIINDAHPMTNVHNYEEVKALCNIIRDKDGNIKDVFHKTIPILTKYERTRILGQRSVQLQNGANPFIDVHGSIINSMTIAEMELRENKIPFIIRRPLPNRGCEYWKVEDLENLH